MARLIVLPNKQTPASSVNVSAWTPGGVVQYSPATKFDINNAVVCANGYTIGAKNTGGSRDGDIYTASGGFTCNVNTKTNNDFYTNTYIGHSDIPAISGDTVNGSNLPGGSVRNSTLANWTKNVKGFVCEVSSKPIGNDSTTDDGSGLCESMGISGVFCTSSGEIKIYEMNNKGTKIFGHDQNSRLPTGSWTKMCYVVDTNSTLNLYHMGWIISFYHKKYQGGNKVYKNCTGRVRYLQPIISSTGAVYSNKATEQQLIMKRRSWTDRNKFQLYTV